MDNDNSNFSHDQAEYKFEKVNNQYDLENFACISDYNNIIPSEKKHLSKTAIVLFLLTVILISVFALFCVVSEIFKRKLIIFNHFESTTIGNMFHLNSEKIPYCSSNHFDHPEKKIKTLFSQENSHNSRT